jgi:hypothetical protein
MTKIVKSNLRQTEIGPYEFEPPSDIRGQEWTLTIRFEAKDVTFTHE